VKHFEPGEAGETFRIGEAIVKHFADKSENKKPDLKVKNSD